MAVLEFDLELGALTPREFVETILVEQLSAVHVVTGADFRFGKARAGDIESIARTGPKLMVSTVSQFAGRRSRGRPAAISPRPACARRCCTATRGPQPTSLATGGL